MISSRGGGGKAVVIKNYKDRNGRKMVRVREENRLIDIERERGRQKRERLEEHKRYEALSYKKMREREKKKHPLERERKKGGGGGGRIQAGLLKNENFFEALKTKHYIKKIPMTTKLKGGGGKGAGP